MRLLLYLFYFLFFITQSYASTIQLNPALSGMNEPTDIQFFPNQNDLVVVLEKNGTAKWASLKTKKIGELFYTKVSTSSELGLLGLAFHPQFNENRKFYINSTVKKNGSNFTEISEWKLPQKDPQKFKAIRSKVLLSVKQPYVNHNAGQLSFGPDGYLYIGFGDGGSADDPFENGQNPKTFLGSMIRINVNTQDKPYDIPADNPFIKNKKHLPEIWAIGLRNPWKFSFSPEGKLIVADVGQNQWEEISIIEKGKNYGWNIMEGNHCFKPRKNCDQKNLEPAVFEYSRDLGKSITGGYVYFGKSIRFLKNKYVFADFVSGRFWAIDLTQEKPPSQFLGKFPILVSSFGQSPNGEIYVAGYNTGIIYQLQAGL